MEFPEELYYNKYCEWLRQRYCQYVPSNTLCFHNYKTKEDINIKPEVYHIDDAYIKIGKGMERI